jgi:outer membrane immunogenic protein
MMKVAVIAISSTFLIGTTYAKSPLSWTGFYAGPEMGVNFNDADLNAHHPGFTNPSGTCNENAEFSSFYPGVQLGYAREFSRFVLGVEGSFTYNVKNSSTFNCTCPTNPNVSDHFSITDRLQTSVRGRIGYAVDHHLMPFLTVGGSFADLGLNYHNEGGDHYSTSATKAGWLAGVGLEWLFLNNWSVSAEYLYTAYSDLNMKIPTIYGLTDTNGSAHTKLYTNNVEVAFNYWF